MFFAQAMPELTATMTIPPIKQVVSIPNLRQAIHSLDSQMAILIAQRRLLESHLEQSVRLQSPVLRLPGELLSSIFVIGVSESDSDDSPIMISCLMLVCRHWADVALNTPLLWSRIAVSDHDSLLKARRMLGRSKAAPLDLTINFSPRPYLDRSSKSAAGGGVTENVIHAMDMFRPALWRTRSLRLSVPNRAQAHAALVRCREDAPLLEVLSIRIFHSIQEDHYHATTNPAHLPLFNGHTPRLRSCSFTSFNFGWNVSAVSHLRVLKLGGYYNDFSPTGDTLLDILQACPNLEELAFRDMSDVDLDLFCSYTASGPRECIAAIPTRRRPIVPLYRLTKASFRCTGLARAMSVLAQSSFPALESLELCYLGGDVTPILQRLENQALTSLPLKELRVEACLFDELKLAQLLRRLPSLNTLELVNDEDVSSCLLRDLSTPAPGQPWTCPNLTTLSIDGCTSLDSEALRTLIESRIPTSSTSTAFLSTPHNKMHVPRQPQRLHAIDVSSCHQISKEMVCWLRMYVREVKREVPEGVWGEPVLP